MPANIIKKYFSFGKNNIVTKATANIVEVCPEGKEWNLDDATNELISGFKLKKLNSKPSLNIKSLIYPGVSHSMCCRTSIFIINYFISIKSSKN